MKPLLSNQLNESVLDHARRDFPVLRREMTIGEALESIRKQGVGERIVYFYALDERDVLVVAHGTLIRAVLQAVDVGPGGEISSHRPDNAEIVMRFMPAGAWASLRARCEAHAAVHSGGLVAPLEPASA